MSGSPFVDFDRASWAELRDESGDLPLTAAELEELRSLGDPVDLDEVRDVYLPVSRLLDLHVRANSGLLEAYRTFLRQDEERTPFVVGIAGSVSVGKSTTARLLRLLLARWEDHPDVALVTTDGFLYPNAELERRGLMTRKGFPESYDRRALLRFVSDVKAGKPEVTAPVYSHLVYDVLDEQRAVTRPDILVIEGLNVLQPAPQTGERASALAVSDLIDFSIYVDAHPADVAPLVHRAVPRTARDRVPRPGVVLPPLRADGGRGRPGARRAAVGRDQRAEPAGEHRPDAVPCRARPDQGS